MQYPVVYIVNATTSQSLLTSFRDKKGVDILPLYQLNNYTINIKLGKMLPYKRPYLILKDKLLVIKKYINEHLNKGFIRPSILLVATPILLIKKLGGGI